jgi:hypothetical protein
MNQDSFQDFIDLSVVLTAFSEFELRGTGYSEKYYDCILHVIGQSSLDELLHVFRELIDEARKGKETKETLLRERLFSSQKMGPLARNIIKMWYVSTWYELPQAWRDAYGTSPNDGTFIVDAWAYPQGLLWPAVGSHPPGAKAPGYGSWTNEPVVPAITVG